MICPNCGGNVLDGEVFCASCGSRVPEQPSAYPEGTMYAGGTPQYSAPPVQPTQPQPQYQQPYQAQPQYRQPQQQYQQPQAQYAQPQYTQPGYTAPDYNTAPPKKSKTPLIVVLVILVLVGVIIGLVVLLATGGGDDDDSSKSKKNSSSAVVDDDDDDDNDDDDSEEDGGGGKAPVVTEAPKTTTTPAPAPAPTSSFAGKWQSVLWLYGGDSYSIDDPIYGDVVKELMVMDLYEDGTGTLTSYGTSSPCSWEDYGSGIILHDGPDDYTTPYEGGYLVMNVDESIIYFQKQ